MTSNRTQVHRPQVERPTEPKVVLEARDLVLIGMKRYDAGEMIEVSKEDYLAAMTKGIHPGTGRPISPLLNHFTLKSAPSDEIYDKAEAFYGEVEKVARERDKQRLMNNQSVRGDRFMLSFNPEKYAEHDEKVKKYKEELRKEIEAEMRAEREKPEPIVPKVDMAPTEGGQPKDEEPAPKRGRPAKQVEE